MPYSKSVVPKLSIWVGIAVVALEPALAVAQISPGGGLGPGGAQPAGEEKKEGVAEAAPKTPGLLPTTPALPAPKGRRKRWKLFEFDGYFRMRTDWMKNFNEGFIDNPLLGGAPFPRALDCSATAVGVGCDDTLSSTNMRLRLEPTINIDEGTSIHIQADILDNQILGGTPLFETYNGVYDSADRTRLPPLGAFGGNQGPPLAGINSDRDAIQLKRAWAEVAVPLGILKAGRMPNHWGMGLLYNGGGYDPINGTYDYDGDYGDTVDRVSFSALIPGTQLRAMIASDWVVTRLSSNQTESNKGHEGHPWDLDDGDDANAWTFVISRMDSPVEFADRVARGDAAFNYGVYFEYKTQDFDEDLSGFMEGGVFDAANKYLARGFKQYSPSLWARLGIGKSLLEGEVIAQLGKIDRLDEFGFTSSADIRKYGGAGRYTYRGLEGKLRIGIEGGFATGDQHDNVIPGNINVAFSDPIGTASDHKLTQFIFNREYKVDQILWRHLVGAVTNAGYVKPFISYDLTKSIAFKVANVTSFALKPVATPGNSTMYGTEFDGDIGYSSNGLFFGFSYGVLFPFAALSHPTGDDINGGDFGFVNDPTLGNNTGEADTSHLIQMKLILSF